MPPCPTAGGGHLDDCTACNSGQLSHFRMHIEACIQPHHSCGRCTAFSFHRGFTLHCEPLRAAVHHCVLSTSAAVQGQAASCRDDSSRKTAGGSTPQATAPTCARAAPNPWHTDLPLPNIWIAGLRQDHAAQALHWAQGVTWHRVSAWRHQRRCCSAACR